MVDFILAVSHELRILFSEPEARTWWPAVVAAIVIAVLYELVTVKGQARPALRRAFLFTQLSHRSSRVDLQLIFIRALLRTAIIAIWPISASFVAVKVISVAYLIYGNPPIVLEGLTLTFVYSLSLLLFSDLSRYILHRLMHQVPLLWRFHQIHHSAEVLTPLSLYRVHPVEQLLQALRGGVVVGFTAGCFAWLSYGQAQVWMLYGLPGIMFLFSVLGANLRHSHVWLPYPRLIEHLFISPAQHQQHHGFTADLQRSNYGSMLAIWDGLFGSLSLSHTARPLRFGLNKADSNHHPHQLSSVLFDPFFWGSQKLRGNSEGENGQQ